MRSVVSTWIVIACGITAGTAWSDGAIEAVAAASLSSCYVSEGAVWCWGSNEAGELAATSGDSTRPVRISGVDEDGALVDLEGVTQLDGDGHICALLESGEVTCWGLGRFGQLGRGDRESSRSPQVVEGVSDAVQVTVGGESSCAVLESGEVACWGANKSGQLGDGTTEDGLKPVRVQGLSDVKQASCGGGATGRGHCCAVREGGKVMCWGAGGDGQLGNRSKKDRERPVLVRGLSDAVQVSAGRSHSCALREEDGEVVCWGNNVFGRLGDKTQKNRSKPTTVRGLQGAVAVVVGSQHSCALREEGDVLCWGDNVFGQIGSGSEEPMHVEATRVQSLSDVVDLAAGWDHACALLKSGELRCWGDNSFGQLGDGSSGEGEHSDVPVPVSMPQP